MLAAALAADDAAVKFAKRWAEETLALTDASSRTEYDHMPANIATMAEQAWAAVSKSIKHSKSLELEVEALRAGYPEFYQNGGWLIVQLIERLPPPHPAGEVLVAVSHSGYRRRGSKHAVAMPARTARVPRFTPRPPLSVRSRATADSEAALPLDLLTMADATRGDAYSWKTTERMP